MSEPRKRFVTNTELMLRCRMLADVIANDGENQIHLVAVGRGGWVPTRLISGFLEAKGLDVTTSSTIISSYTGTQRGKITFHDDLRIESGRANWIIDDLVDSGSTMEAILARARQTHAGMIIQTAVVFYKPKSTHTPTAYAEVVDSGEWIVFPYETEAME
jgi:hypoxanthine phosphoribosyltransferase